jgi:hypothetical protein
VDASLLHNIVAHRTVTHADFKIAEAGNALRATATVFFQYLELEPVGQIIDGDLVVQGLSIRDGYGPAFCSLEHCAAAAGGAGQPYEEFGTVAPWSFMLTPSAGDSGSGDLPHKAAQFMIPISVPEAFRNSGGNVRILIYVDEVDKIPYDEEPAGGEGYDMTSEARRSSTICAIRLVKQATTTNTTSAADAEGAAAAAAIEGEAETGVEGSGSGSGAEVGAGAGEEGGGGEEDEELAAALAGAGVDSEGAATAGEEEGGGGGASGGASKGGSGTGSAVGRAGAGGGRSRTGSPLHIDAGGDGDGDGLALENIDESRPGTGDHSHAASNGGDVTSKSSNRKFNYSGGVGSPHADPIIAAEMEALDSSKRLIRDIRIAMDYDDMMALQSEGYELHCTHITAEGPATDQEHLWKFHVMASYSTYRSLPLLIIVFVVMVLCWFYFFFLGLSCFLF